MAAQCFFDVSSFPTLIGQFLTHKQLIASLIPINQSTTRSTYKIDSRFYTIREAILFYQYRYTPIIATRLSDVCCPTVLRHCRDVQSISCSYHYDWADETHLPDTITEIRIVAPLVPIKKVYDFWLPNSTTHFQVSSGMAKVPIRSFRNHQNLKTLIFPGEIEFKEFPPSVEHLVAPDYGCRHGDLPSHIDKPLPPKLRSLRITGFSGLDLSHLKELTNLYLDYQYSFDNITFPPNLKHLTITRASELTKIKEFPPHLVSCSIGIDFPCFFGFHDDDTGKIHNAIVQSLLPSSIEELWYLDALSDPHHFIDWTKFPKLTKLYTLFNGYFKSFPSTLTHLIFLCPDSNCICHVTWTKGKINTMEVIRSLPPTLEYLTLPLKLANAMLKCKHPPFPKTLKEIIIVNDRLSAFDHSRFSHIKVPINSKGTTPIYHNSAMLTNIYDPDMIHTRFKIAQLNLDLELHPRDGLQFNHKRRLSRSPCKLSHDHHEIQQVKHYRTHTMKRQRD